MIIALFWIKVLIYLFNKFHLWYQYKKCVSVKYTKWIFLKKAKQIYFFRIFFLKCKFWIVYCKSILISQKYLFWDNSNRELVANQTENSRLEQRCVIIKLVANQTEYSRLKQQCVIKVLAAWCKLSEIDRKKCKVYREAFFSQKYIFK